METRNYAVSHQILCILDVDFNKQRIYGFTELTINLLRDDSYIINLNCKQSKIYSVVFNGQYEASFEYYDPTLMIMTEEDERRDLQTFLTQEELAIASVDAEENNGELAITIPFECQELFRGECCVTEAKQTAYSDSGIFISNLSLEQKVLKVAVEFVLENPKGGIQFFIPPIPADQSSDTGCPTEYLFTCDHNPNLWFPCVNSANELSTWKIEITVAKTLTAITSGDLVEKKVHDDGQHVTYHYYLSIPTSPANIGLVIGDFEVYTDENINEITSYCLPELQPLLKNTTSFLHDVFEFYEEYLSTQFPYTSYKQVFVNNAYDDMTTYATFTIFNVNLLHPNTIVDQTILTRRLMATAMAKQFFGSYIVPQACNDTWLVNGLAQLLSGLYYKKSFGNNEYKYMVYKEMKEVGKYEKEQGFILLDFKYDPKEAQTKCHFSVKHADMMSPEYVKHAEKKAHLVLRLIDDYISGDVMAQMLNRILSMANVCASQKYIPKAWCNMVLSADTFVKLAASYMQKDIKPLLDQWVYKAGFARFSGTFSFNRKRNIVEIDLKQDMLNHRGCRKYIGPLSLIVQEIDGSFTHTIQIEENTTRYEITCHTKLRRNKKKKTPLSTGEEVDIDLSQYDTDTSILWIRLDPEMKLLREIKFDQPDHHWQNQLKHERDIVSQLESIDTLTRFQSLNTRTILASIIDNYDLYYQVRIHAAYALANVANKMVNTWNGPLALIASFKKMFMSHACPTIIKYNNFTDLQQYLLQKHMPIAMGNLRNVHNMCPNEITRFLLDLIRYNENSKNRFSDAYYKAALIDALAATITSTAYAANAQDIKSTNLSQELRLVIEEIVLRLNLEKLVPTYRYTVTCSCLNALRSLQKLGHIPENISIFKQYAQYGTFDDVRMTAFEIIVKYLEVRNDETVMNYLLDFIQNDPSFLMRHHIIRLLCKHPPFTPSKHQHSDFSMNLNSDKLVNKLWKLVNNTTFDYRLRNDLVDLYNALYGLGKPRCLSKQIMTKETLKLSEGIQPLKY